VDEALFDTAEPIQTHNRIAGTNRRRSITRTRTSEISSSIWPNQGHLKGKAPESNLQQGLEICSGCAHLRVDDEAALGRFTDAQSHGEADAERCYRQSDGRRAPGDAIDFECIRDVPSHYHRHRLPREDQGLPDAAPNEATLRHANLF
jgi:hypothetical protein